ncbi:MAG: phosphoribosylformylglycinamidine synthase subunit PurS [Chlorobiales bacterium]|jgi:phosphoribosylformylglycinamidine synthase subunit PurS|nr:phosphoribosylformylglycinamidine synthase subunit PurS [Chlorobiales bacterium]
MGFRAKIKVTLRKSILDVQGKTVYKALGNLGYKTVDSVRIGKYIEVEINETNRDAAAKVTEEVCEKLLANMVMEDYTYELEEV